MTARCRSIFADAPLRLATPRGLWRSQDVAAATGALADELSRAGAGPDIVIGHAFGLEPIGALALQAVARTGAVLAPTHPGWTDPEREDFLRVVAPRLALTSAGAAWARNGWTCRPVSLHGVGAVSLWNRNDVTPGPVEPVLGTEGGALLGTSGGGGARKFVRHDWRSLWANAEAANERLGFDADGTWIATLAWAHVGGLAVALRTAAAGGTLAFGPPRFEAADVIRAIDHHTASHVSLVPAMLHRLLELDKRAPAALRVALLGGAATPPGLVQRAVAAGWPIALTYGLTEAGSQVATAPPDEVRGHPDAVGSALRDTEIRILSRSTVDDSVDDVGVIEVRGRTLFRGYWRGEIRDPEGWFATGDLGHLDGDGRLFVTGRLGDRIVTGGANVDPAEIEAVLAGHPDVREAVVLGLPDEVFGEIVAAVVVGEGGDLAARLAVWARARLSGPRAPRRWAALDRLPRTSTGKVDRSLVRALLMPDTEEES